MDVDTSNVDDTMTNSVPVLVLRAELPDSKAVHGAQRHGLATRANVFEA